MTERRSATFTFLFTDLEGSTRLWEAHPDAMQGALARHDEIVQHAIELHRGEVVKKTGDGFHAAFVDAADAVAATVDAQTTLAQDPWPETGPLRVRMGVHTGGAELRDGDYYGTALNRAARLMGIAHGGQVVVSQATEALVRDALPAGVELLDLGSHQLSDLARPEQVFQVLGPGLEHEFPPLRSVGPRGNLPLPVTSFIGRERELGKIGDLLLQARVVTLTGVGGVGKTRLALQAASAVASRYRDGCWSCELAPLRDPDAVPDAILGTFGGQARAGVGITEALVDFLRGKALLLVLDNCEHLLQPVAQLVARIERSCADVQILATSREGLNVDGEHIMVVSSLEVPDVDMSVDELARAASVQLFVERAQERNATFALDATNADAVAQICRRLDGIALAIELAAARVSSLAPEEIARRLDDRFRVLAGGRRTAVERHQTLRAAIDWSYDLLDEPEQLLFERLSVFAGGFTLASVEAVASGDGVDIDAVFDLLPALVARSLVVATTDGVATRYTLFETIRQYAQERLEDRGDGERVRRRHAECYAAFAEKVGASPATLRSSIEWERQLTPELDNLRAALTWAVDDNDADVALRLLGNMPGESVAVQSALHLELDRAIALPGGIDHPRRPAVLVLAAYQAIQRGDYERGARLCDEAADAEAKLGTEPSPNLRQARGMMAMARGAYAEHCACAEEAAAICRARGDGPRLATALSVKGWALLNLGDADAAIAAAEEALAMVRRDFEPASAALALPMVAYVLADTQPERARALAREAVALAEQLGRGWDQQIWNLAGNVATRIGDRREALAFYERGIDGWHWLGWQPVLGLTISRVGDLLAPDDQRAAALLHGAGDVLAHDAVVPPESAELHRHALDLLRASLPPDELTKLNGQGAGMTEDEIMQFAHDAIGRFLGRDESALNRSSTPGSE